MSLAVAININNDPKILKLIIESLPYLHSRWTYPGIKTIMKNYEHSSPGWVPKYYIFDFKNKRLLYMSSDKHGETYKFPINVIRNASQASLLMDYIYLIDSTERIKDSEDGKWKICDVPWF